MRITFVNIPPKNPKWENNLPPAQAYIHPEQKLRYFRVALVLSLIVLAYFMLDLNISGGKSMLPGSLSSSHANFGNDCAKCHVTFSQVEDAKCSACHKESSVQFSIASAQYHNTKTSKYSFAAHYTYRSDSLIRARRNKVKAHELPCRTCHTEHRGRGFKLSAVYNNMCGDCHFSDFNEDHPNFQFARTTAPDDSALKFTHIKHVREVRKLSPSIYSNTQSTCSYCHEVEPDGKLFKPISFDRHCSDCHLTNTLTIPLPIASKNNGEGVLTVAELRERNDVSTQWARAANPNEFRLLGETRLLKRVVHRDPWILWHLSQWGIDLTEQALETRLLNIRMSIAILRMTQDSTLHSQLSRVDTVLRKLQSSQPKTRNTVNPKIQTPLNPLADKIAKPCVQCHILSGAEVLPVNGEQEVMRRANFDHHAHIVQAKCLDCHFKIDVEKVSADSLLAIRQDRSSIQNLPEIENCRQCHSEDKATTDCSGCHEFHP